MATLTPSTTDLGAVLVVGGCGYLGSHLVQLLEPHSTSIHVVSRNPTSNLHPFATYHAGDIASYEQISSLLAQIKPQVIFHTASPKYTASEKQLRQTNLDGTRNLLKCASESPYVRALVYTGTDSAVVQAPGVKLTEVRAELYTEKSPVNPYAKTKAIADFEVRAANGPELRTAVIRIPGLYGEDDDNCIGSLLSTVKKNQHNIQVGTNKRCFEFVYVESACMAHILAARALLLGGEKDKVDGEAFFVSDGVSLPYFDFARKIYAFAGHPVQEKDIRVMPYRLILGFAVLGEWLYWAFTFGTIVPDMRKLGIEYLGGGCEWDISKAKERLGYKPVADQDTVLKQVAESEAKRLGI
ncbi:Sterol-4-alpha-carboxylate 3-dehydrogenase,decarboxylating [Lachnellula occidentalis]|uniref:Sterol-4-alpha-carboxylate 3-dehydrogenase,decarboxylating n=1 Tax=Lachnellula occidentalis TaxID=215460 RepID=A0A8H8RRY6_9HELO|nr:Sterol-4-alpha-carboxylate 3-dehydrogenase,decarboxylating [Lachnellula occidentalis]